MNGNDDFIRRIRQNLQMKDGELCLILAEYVEPETYYEPSDFKGLTLANIVNNQGKIIIICSHFSRETLMPNVQFKELIAKKNIGFLKIPFSSEDLWKKYLECSR